jgi:hypothetical protein
MALQAERAHVRQIALTSAFGHGQNMIGIPQRLAPAETPLTYGSHLGCAAQLLEAAPLGYAIDTANRTYAPVALKDPLAKMAWIAAQPPFLYAPLRTKRQTARRNLQAAPSAETTSVFAFGKSFAVGTPAGHRALSAHRNRIAIKCSEPHGRGRSRLPRPRSARRRSSAPGRNY